MITALQRPMSPRERRLLAVALLVAALAAAWLLLLAPLLDGFTDRAERRNALLTEQARAARLLAGLGRWREAAERQGETMGDHAIAGPTAALAGEALVARLREQVTELGGSATASLLDPDDGRPGWVRARLEGELGEAQLVELLRRLQAPPHLVVTGLSVAASPLPTAPGNSRPVELRLEVAAPALLPEAR